MRQLTYTLVQLRAKAKLNRSKCCFQLFLIYPTFLLPFFSLNPEAPGLGVTTSVLLLSPVEAASVLVRLIGVGVTCVSSALRFFPPAFGVDFAAGVALRVAFFEVKRRGSAEG